MIIVLLVPFLNDVLAAWVAVVSNTTLIRPLFKAREPAERGLEVLVLVGCGILSVVLNVDVTDVVLVCSWKSWTLVFLLYFVKKIIELVNSFFADRIIDSNVGLWHIGFHLRARNCFSLPLDRCVKRSLRLACAFNMHALTV